MPQPNVSSHQVLHKQNTTYLWTANQNTPNKMDTRKLSLYQHKRSRPVHIGIGDNYDKVATLKTSDEATDRRTAAELVKRWNAYPELVIALRECLSALQPPDMGGLTGAEHDAGAAEAEITRARTLLQSLNP